MIQSRINNTCPKCGAVGSFDDYDGMISDKKCRECGKKFSSEILNDHQYKFEPANPRCPNENCEFHESPPPAKKAFVINVIEEGLMGKIFRSEAYGMVSCKNCGEIVGVGGKG